MNTSEYEEKFFGLFEATAELYSKKFSGAVFELWFNDIRRFDYDAVKRAFAIHRQNPDSGQFMPKPGDIVKILEGSSKDHAFLAWTKVKKSILSVGSYSSICFDDPIIHLVIKDLGGWVGLCQGKEEELKFISNEFRSRYEGYRSRGEIPKFPKRLSGIHEADNTKNKYLDFIEPPVLIGNETKAKRVLLGHHPKLKNIQLINKK